MTRQLVLLHGRSQEKKEAAALKAEWLEALDEGLAKSGLQLPIAEADVRFPFYGDTLYEMVDGRSAENAAEVIVRGEDADDDQRRFIGAVLEEVRVRAGISAAQMAELTGEETIARGPLNWAWTHAVAKAIDRFVPYGSGLGVALATYDVYQYLRNSNIREEIETGVAAALTPGVETVVVSHSLGTVVAYNLLRQQGRLRGWRVPLLVTLGSPLAVGEIRKTLRAFAPIRCPEPVAQWFNALDKRDIVALYPLDPASFPLAPATPAIENKQDVKNKTRNRHGISGYLDDAEVARRIHRALAA
jgi:hypothetical protein